jgi:branched-chain amino acid transport system ATP-binding protein
MLRLEGVTAGYGPVQVIRGVDLHVRAGETVALLGPNGAGKSTLLAAITGTLQRRSGSILIAGRNIVAAPSHSIVQAGLTLVPEGRLMFSPMSVEDNLRLGALRLRASGGKTPKHTLAERFDHVYGLFPRLHERRSQLAGTLSGGEQQMVAIGRALMSAPRMLLLDEPFLGLAPLVVAEIRTALESLRGSGLTLLIVEQKLDIALGFASRASVMIKGRIALQETTQNLAQRRDLTSLYFELAAADDSEQKKY